MSEVKHQYFCTKCGTTRDSLLDHPAIGIGGYSWNCPRCNGPVDSREVIVSEAPKKIWVDDEVLWGSALELQSDYKKETAYIRADLVDDLVEALEFLLTCKHGEFCEHYREAEFKAKAALARVKEEG